jgi:hypothetical protein
MIGENTSDESRICIGQWHGPDLELDSRDGSEQGCRTTLDVMTYAVLRMPGSQLGYGKIDDRYGPAITIPSPAFLPKLQV